MDTIPFCKMSGSGNDFIIIDNRGGRWDYLKTPEFVRKVCTRKLSVGADGLIFIENSDRCDFAWSFFNSDGSTAEMCGNGGRCAARFAVLQGIADTRMSFETMAGIIHADVDGARVKIQLPRPSDLETDIRLEVYGTDYILYSIHTGVPHVVHFVKDLDRIQVKAIGEQIRFHERFQPAGTNVNFVVHDRDNMLHIRTYERGVEDETYACGTGSVAAALVGIAMHKVTSPVHVKTRSGEVLTVHTAQSAPPFIDVYLEGGAQVVYQGELWQEQW